MGGDDISSPHIYTLKICGEVTLKANHPSPWLSILNLRRISFLISLRIWINFLFIFFSFTMSLFLGRSYGITAEGPIHSSVNLVEVCNPSSMMHNTTVGKSSVL